MAAPSTWVIAMDGLQNAVLYALVALSLVLVFSVTRVILVPIGDLAMYAPLSHAQMLAGRIPATAWLAAALLVLWALLDFRQPPRRARPGRWSGALLLAAAGAEVGLAYLGARGYLGPALWLAAGLLVVPLGPATYRLFFEPVGEGSVLLNLMLAVGLHFVYQGLGLTFFGPEQYRLPALWDGRVLLGTLPVPRQALLLDGFALAAAAAMYLVFRFTVAGRALRACAINRLGARISGIDPREAGRWAFAGATALAVTCGQLVAPLVNAAYFMGFPLALKGFVAAIVGGLGSFPLTVLGAVLVGFLDAYGAFAASAYRDAIVFGLLLPVLAWRSFTTVELGGAEE